MGIFLAFGSFLLIATAPVTPWPLNEQGESGPSINAMGDTIPVPNALSYQIPSMAATGPFNGAPMQAGGPVWNAELGGIGQPLVQLPINGPLPQMPPTNREFNGGEFPFIRPYRAQFPQEQYPPPVAHADWSRRAPPPLPPQWDDAGPPPPLATEEHRFVEMPERFHDRLLHSRVDNRRGPQQPAFPLPSPLDSAPLMPTHTNGQGAASITVQYNVTYAFMPTGWEVLDVSPANATYYPASSGRIGRITNMENEDTAQSETRHVSEAPMANPWVWPQTTGSEVDGKPVFPGKTGLEKEPSFYNNRLIANRLRAR